MKNTPFKRPVLVCLALFGATLVLCGVFYTLGVSSQTQELTFGYGLQVQLVDPSGRNSVQFMAYDAPLSATLQLYSLSPGQFISFYNALPSWWEDAHLDPSGLPLVAEWQQAVTRTYQLQATALPSVPLGFYLLTIGNGAAVQDELMVILSHDTLLLKASASDDAVQVVAWASRLSTGEPLPGAAITIYDDAGQALASGVTDANGLYEVHITGANPQALLAIGATGDGLTACGTRYEWNSGDGWFGATSTALPHKVYLYTDRPIYRPGHTVHYKGILRHDDDGDYTPLTTQAVTVSVRDARENVLLTMPASPSSFGTISGSFTLADEAGLGEYHLEVSLDGHTYRQPFKVEEYRKPDYAVTVNTSHDFYVLGDLVSVTVASDYYFGQPVVGGNLEFNLYRQEWGDLHPVWGTTGTTDEQGRWTTVINSADHASGDATFVLEAFVDDQSGQFVLNDARVSVYYAEYGLSMRLEKYGYAPGEAIPVNLQALAHDGAPVVSVPLTVTVLTWGQDDYVEVSRALGTTDETGAAQVTFQLSEPGWYKLQAQGQDGRGRAVTAQGWFWVYSPGWGWGGQPEDELSVSADKDSYAPGEVAQLLVHSPVTGTALLSLERGHTRQAHPVFLSDTVSLITLPIGNDYAPNLFATVNVFQRGWEPEFYYWDESSPEGRLLFGSVELIVPADDQVLQVELRPDKTTYRPREAVTFTIQVRDQAGQPVVAEVSLGLVDEAIYALSKDLSDDIHETFYGRRDDDVVSYDSLRPRRHYSWGAPTDPAPTVTPRPPGGGDDGELDSDAGDVRRDFPDTAYWNPGVRTDPQGRATISLTLPDNLTRWRALARAVSLDTQVGEATTAITVTQKLIVRPALPRFLIQGDLVRLRTIAHNYLSHAITATLELSTSGLVMLDADTSPPTSLPPGGTGVADWSAVASELGQGSVLARLRAGDGTLTNGDAVELPLPIQPFAVPEIISRVGQVEHEITETLYLSVTAIPGATSLRVRLSSSIALGLLDGLEYLIGYPYG
jgi:uncharacterized protein YfaS (alpha-2-macroglobulin family)